MRVEPTTGTLEGYLVSQSGLHTTFMGRERDWKGMIEWARMAQGYAEKLVVGAELEDEDGEKRYVLEPAGKNTQDYEVQLTGSEFGDFCRCESWYSVQEILDRFSFTGNIVDVSGLETFQVQCDCEDEHD